MHEQIHQVLAQLHGMWRYRWSALLIVWLAAIAGILVVYALPPVYNSNAVVYVDTTSIMKPLLKGLAVESDPEKELKIISRTLLSRKNLLAVIRETDLDHRVTTPEQRQALVEDLAKDITLKGVDDADRRGQRNDIFEIDYESPSAEQSHEVVSTLLNILVEDTLSSGRKDVQRAQTFLKQRIKEYEDRLSKAEQRLTAFKKRNAGHLPDEKGGFYKRLQGARDRVSQTESNLVLAKEKYAGLRKQLTGESPVLGGEDGRPSPSAARLADLKQKLADLKTRFTDNHPDVQALETKIAQLEKSIEAGNDDAGAADQGGSQTLNPIYQDLKAKALLAKATITEQQAVLAEQRKQLKKLEKSADVIPQVEANYVELNRDYDVTKQRYLDLIERLQSAKLAEKAKQNSSSITFRVIDPPIVPLKAAGPNRPLLLLAALVVALGGGVGWSILRLLLHPIYTDSTQLRANLDLPVLGAVSNHMGPYNKRRRRFKAANYAFVLVLLIGVFGVAFWFMQDGTGLVRSFVTQVGIPI